MIQTNVRSSKGQYENITEGIQHIPRVGGHHAKEQLSTSFLVRLARSVHRKDDSTWKTKLFVTSLR